MGIESIEMLFSPLLLCLYNFFDEGKSRKERRDSERLPVLPLPLRPEILHPFFSFFPLK
jgi:hypothetical protein